MLELVVVVVEKQIIQTELFFYCVIVVCGKLSVDTSLV